MALVRPPIIDVHLHALSAEALGPPPLGLCLPIDEFPTHDDTRPWGDSFLRWLKEPPCSRPLWSPKADDELREASIQAMEQWNVFGVVSGTAERVETWRSRAPDRVMPALQFSADSSSEKPDDLRRLHAAGQLTVLGEVLNQYAGITPDDERFEPYLALCEELDIPVAIHVGPGPPGSPYLGSDGYRARLHSPLLLEEALVRHPRLRVQVMHAGWPMLDDMVALMFAHPRVYVDVGLLGWGITLPEFHRYLQRLVEGGFGNRVMFGSDQMVWPGLITYTIEALEAAPFLSEPQKRAIFYDNAARFLRLDEAEMARHHGR